MDTLLQCLAMDQTLGFLSCLVERNQPLLVMRHRGLHCCYCVSGHTVFTIYNVYVPLPDYTALKFTIIFLYTPSSVQKVINFISSLAARGGSWVVDNVVDLHALQTPDDTLIEQMKRLQLYRKLIYCFRM